VADLLLRHSDQPLIVVVDGLLAAFRAAAAAKALKAGLILISAPAGARHGGCSWFAGVVNAVRAACPVAPPERPITAILDCGDDAGAVLAALADCGRGGELEAVVFTGPAAAVAGLAELAAVQGVTVLTTRPAALWLCPGGDAVGAARDWLAQANEI
jgi:hypothetical protein